MINNLPSPTKISTVLFVWGLEERHIQFVPLSGRAHYVCIYSLIALKLQDISNSL